MIFICLCKLLNIAIILHVLCFFISSRHSPVSIAPLTRQYDATPASVTPLTRQYDATHQPV